jgi:N-acetyl-gamma-glutamyl-phosphate reductase
VYNYALRELKSHPSLQDIIKASIIGASGYSGAELLTILQRHRHVKVEGLFANTSSGKKLSDVFPRFAGRIDTTLESFSADAASMSDVTFIALPSGEAMNIVPELLKRDNRIIDLGGDFRLKDASQYQKFYSRNHTAAQYLSSAVYGLPEWNAEQISSASLVANPGCYPTSAILPLAPLLKENIIESKGISVSSLSGVSGAGRSASLEMSFGEVNESVRAYKVGTHQHTPEMTQTLGDIAERSVALTFVPHLLPLTRGIYTSTFAAPTRKTSDEEIFSIYQKYYGNKPFIRVSSTAIPEIKNVNHTNFIDIGFRLDPDNNQLILLSAIDNLIKGAAGQAVQNMNLMFGFDETEGLW